MDDQQLSGGCACGAVRFITNGPPIRVGLCHCMMCRRAHAAAFSPFVVFDADRVEVIGKTRKWQSSLGYDRCFCTVCGSRVIGINGDEVELSMGSFDEVGMFEPEYESWVVRREPWLAALLVPQNSGDRPIRAVQRLHYGSVSR